MRIEVAGENALILYFGDIVNPELSTQIQHASSRIANAMGDLLIDQIASYASLLVIYDPLRCNHLNVRSIIRKVINDIGVTGTDSNSKRKTYVKVPVYYSEESGPDLYRISERSGLGIKEIIEIHQGSTYRAYAIGFAPGFAFLGHVDQRIATPRLKTPRLKVPSGAVGIADRQTAVYPDETPGGWNLIGLCPIQMFNPKKIPSMIIKVGDDVRFKAINREEFINLGGKLDHPA